MPKISIIVPVYNTEKYLHCCVDSILAQTYTDFELLLIDDGSTDNSGDICNEYISKDSRVSVFHKQNGGVSSARNLGLDNAKGEWVAFIDSDDWIKTDYLFSMINLSDSDLIVNSFSIVDDLEDWKPKIDNKKYENKEIKFFVERFIWSASFCTPWCKLFKKSIIGDLRFDVNLSLAEDTIFVFQYLCKVSTIRTVENYGYQYRRGINDSLSMKRYSVEEYLYIIKENSCKLKQVENRFDYNGTFVRIARTGIIFKQCLDVIRDSKYPIRKRYKYFVELLNNDNVNEMFKYRNLKYKCIRRRFFDFFALNKLYPILFLYVINYKGFLY